MSEVILRCDIERILRNAVGADYMKLILEHETENGNTICDIIAEDVKTSSAWASNQQYNDDDIRLAIGRVLLRCLIV